MKVDIRGYQILENASIGIDGITMIIGSNNNGKSSFIRAIEDALFNTMGEDFINDKMSSATVDISFEQEGDKLPLKIWWQKPRKGGATYSINGVDSKKLGRKTPQDLLSPYGIKEIDVRGKKERIFFWRQFDPLFMVTSNPSYIFDFLSSLMEEKKMIPILKEMAADNKEIQDRMIYLEGSIKALEDSLKQMGEKEKHLSEVEKIKDFIIELRKLKVALQRTSECSVGITQLTEQIEAGKNQLVIINKLTEKIPDLSSQEKGIRELNFLSRYTKSLTDLQIQLDGDKKNIEIIEYVDEIKTSLDISEPEVVKLSKLEKSHSDIMSLNSKISWAQEDLNHLIEDTNKAIDEFETFKNSIKVCPTCERSF